MGSVTAVDMDVVTKDSGHNCVGMAVSVCTTPAAPSPIPVPYPLEGTVEEGITDAAMRTKIGGADVMTVGSCMSECHGNEPGTLKEVVSLNTAGPSFPIIGAPIVVIELGMTGITGSPGFMNKAITEGEGGSASDAGGDAGGGGGGGGGGGAPAPTGPESPAASSGAASSSATSAAAAPTAEEQAKAQKMVSHLDKQVQDDVARSPTLQKQLAKMHDESPPWKVNYRTDGGVGADCHRGRKEIRLDKNWGDSNSAALAHEVGHASYTPAPYSPPTATDTKQSYVDRNLKNHFDDEGAATFNNCKARDEIRQNSGGKRDIGVLGQNSKQYQDTYDQHKANHLTQQQAQDQMGQGYKTEHTGNTKPPQSYSDYYGNHYSNTWDQTHPAGGSGGGGGA